MPTTLRGIGDAIEGERVVCIGHKKTREDVIRRSNSHRGIRIVIERGVRCEIEAPIKLKDPDSSKLNSPVSLK